MLPADREFALDIKNVLAEVCQRGYANRAAIWNEHHLNKPPTARRWPQNPQIHSQKFEEIKKPAMSLTTFSPGLEKLCTELHQPVIGDRSGRHATFIERRLRRDEDEHSTYSQKLAVIAGLDTPNTGLDSELDPGLATIQGKGLFTGLAGLNPQHFRELSNFRKKTECNRNSINKGGYLSKFCKSCRILA